MDISKISYNDHTLFHMLRHFECINENARQCLLSRGYSHSKIDANLAIPGSKFHSSFATDLKTLVAQFDRREISKIESKGKYIEHRIRYQQFELTNGIGTKALIHISDLEIYGATEIVDKLNRGVVLKHAFVKSIPDEWDLIFVLKPQKNYDLLITAFPGLPTMSLPKKGMEMQSYKKAIAFWEKHVFLERG